MHWIIAGAELYAGVVLAWIGVIVVVGVLGLALRWMVKGSIQ